MASGLQSGAYISVRQQRTRSHGDCVGPGSLLFIDNALSDDATALRRIPASALRNHQAPIVIRAEHPLSEGVTSGDLSKEAEQVSKVIDQWGLPMPVGLLHQPLGEPAWIEAVQKDPKIDLTHARALELEALLEWNSAIWRPTDYHYRLPSGEHAEGFIKLTDAIREPRDAEVLASWLMPHMREETGFVLDTGTMTPIYEAAAKRASEAEWDTGPVAVLEHYPRTSVDVHDAVEFAAGGKGRVLAVLSVNSSGRVRDRIISAMEGTTGLDEPRLVVLVDKDRPSTNKKIETWSPLPGHDPLVRRGVPARDTCSLCSDSKRSRLIPINPFTFDGMATGELLPIMPSIRDAQANWELWQQCSRDKGVIAIESQSVIKDSVARASSHPMTVRVDIEELLDRPEFGALATSSFEKLLKDPPTKDDPLAPVRWTRLPLSTGSDLVLVPEHEQGHANFSAFWKQISLVIAPKAKVESFPIEGELESTLKETIAEAKNILIFSLGSVSGHSLQRALFAVQQSHHQREYDLQGLVLHARLPTAREWQTLCNSFDRRLHAGWIFFLPEGSPLRDESKTLKALELGDFEGEARDFIEERLRLCAGEVQGQKPPLFWGSSADARLTRNSIFGQRLDARTTFTAVGAAMARGRIDNDRRTPEVRVFDLAGMLRSYYDPLIIASFFRWLGPYEAWWGWKASEAEGTINALFARVQDDDAALKVLIPELLLATAQGKVHDAAFDVIAARAEQLRDRVDPSKAAAIEVGLNLALTQTEESGLTEPSVQPE